MDIVVGALHESGENQIQQSGATVTKLTGLLRVSLLRRAELDVAAQLPGGRVLPAGVGAATEGRSPERGPPCHRRDSHSARGAPRPSREVPSTLLRALAGRAGGVSLSWLSFGGRNANQEQLAPRGSPGMQIHVPLRDCEEFCQDDKKHILKLNWNDSEICQAQISGESLEWMSFGICQLPRYCVHCVALELGGKKNSGQIE
ncbi:uncharacterized protein LOC113968967 [Neopelma chrysocephalum]|uniref:uncharacterized protein LOC113968967 n=1 Tax=Neopelma chrysocephalum TaxID=114329 RepID=UPI000FCCECD5|nr:uncharacterized protein LOC113968967 [Neopelma chrysocephalum]